MRALKLKLSPFHLPLTTASMQPVLSVFVTICYFGGFFVFCGFYPETGEGVVFTSHNSHFYCDFVIDLYLIILG